MPAPLALFAACQPGLEPFLVGELKALGAEPQAQRGGVAFRGDQALLLRCGLWLGTASHLLVRLGQFDCRALGELQRKSAELPWREWLRPQVPLRVDATARGSRIYHSGAAAERVAGAVAHAFGRAVPEARTEDDVFATVHVRVRDDVCTISLDTTGTPLHRRGYRLDARKAPLREDLAHALVLASGFRPGDALLDPFCGSGTIAIEAAALALGLPPGRLRPPPLEHSVAFDPELWLAVRQEPHPAAPAAAAATAAGAAAAATTPTIAGGDRDAGAVLASRANAARAGVQHTIAWHEGALTTHPWLQPGGAPPRGALVTNPPFGLRAKGGDLRPLYQTLGHRAQALGEGWRLALLAHDIRLARRTALPLRAAFTTKHGGLTVTALVGATTAPATAGDPPAVVSPRRQRRGEDA